MSLNWKWMIMDLILIPNVDCERRNLAHSFFCFPWWDKEYQKKFLHSLSFLSLCSNCTFIVDLSVCSNCSNENSELWEERTKHSLKKIQIENVDNYLHHFYTTNSQHMTTLQGFGIHTRFLAKSIRSCCDLVIIFTSPRQQITESYFETLSV